MMPRIWIVAMLVLLLPQTLWAKKVYSPHAEPGAVEFETQTDILRHPDPARDGSIKQQFELEYGLNDWWSMGLYGVFQKSDNGSRYDYTSTKWENIFVLPKLESLGLEWGVYAEYVLAAPASGKADVVEGKLLLEERGERWHHTANIILKRELALMARTTLGYAWRSQYAFRDVELAVEAYGSLGPLSHPLPASSQSHLVGPVVTMEPWDDIEFEFGWLMDVNAGPAYGDFKINMEFGF